MQFQFNIQFTWPIQFKILTQVWKESQFLILAHNKNAFWTFLDTFLQDARCIDVKYI